MGDSVSFSASCTGLFYFCKVNKGIGWVVIVVQLAAVMSVYSCDKFFAWPSRVLNVFLSWFLGLGH